MKVCVIGLGYIGLPTAAMFAGAGHEVTGVDKNSEMLKAYERGEITIEEEGLAELVKDVTESGMLKFSPLPVEADAFIIAVPTPIKEDKKADMKFVSAATRELATVLKKGDLVVLESTSPVGTVDSLMVPILEEITGLKAGRDFSIGHSPERVIPGRIIYELVNNSRIAGGFDAGSSRRIKELYASFVKGDIYEADSRTAELCKLAENTYRDVNIAFANELARICEAEGVNVWELISLCNRHPRVNIHQPGPGVGGHCVAVDPWFIVEKEPSLARMIRLSREINDSMPAHVADRAQEILKGVEDAKICILGISYKPDADDIRESPILKLADILRERGFELSLQDPHAHGRAGALEDMGEAAAGADLLVIGVNHSVYKSLDYKALAGVMRSLNLLDTRGFADIAAAASAGFSCYLLGDRR